MHLSQPSEEVHGQVAPDDLAAYDDDESLEALRGILLGEYRDRVTELRTQIRQLQSLLTDVEQQVELLNDPNLLAEKITPSLAPAISTSIRESREAMVDALHPIMGRLVTRAVAEALRELVRRIDNQMRSTFSFKTVTRRMQARIAGVSDAELALRDALPFQVYAIFLIYRESGLLLSVRSLDRDLSEDSDVISGMLTAIRDFVHDAFGRKQEGQLNEVQYGENRILIESAQYIYAAVVCHGTEPVAFRTDMRERLGEIELEYLDLLREYDGNAAQFVGIEEQLDQLMPVDTGDVSVIRVPTQHAEPIVVPNPAIPTAPLALAVRLTLLAMIGLLILLLWRLWQIWHLPQPQPDLVGLLWHSYMFCTHCG
jgi:hypothetical protein